MKYRLQTGFTVIELIFVIALLGVASVLFFVQKDNLQTANLDEHRKIAINAIYFNLEEVFYPKNGHYPQSLNNEMLQGIDPELLIDINKTKIDGNVDTTGMDDETKKAYEEAGKQTSEYRYEPTNCDNTGKCKSYSLRVSLTNEAEYVKTSRHN